MKNNTYIGITENRLHHIKAVAEECYRIAKEEGFPEEFCRKMFVIGWNHDIGYEFSEESLGHAKIGGELISLIGACERSVDAITYHGYDMEHPTDEWRILNTADMTVDHMGNRVSVKERLESIETRYGKESAQYQNAIFLAKKIGLS